MAEKRPSGAKSAPILLRLIKMLFSFYPVMLPVALGCILFNAIISSIPSIFMQNVISLVEQSWQAGDWAAVGGQILHFVLILVVLYPGLSCQDARKDVQRHAGPSHQVF